MGNPNNCSAFSANDDDAVFQWDKGVAFYTGSLEGTANGGNSAGKLLYRQAEKRCADQLRHLHPETIP